VCGARAWTGETNGARGRRIQLVGGGSVLTGTGGEGGPGGWTPRGDRVEEREGGRGGPGRGVEQRGNVGVTRSTWLTGGPRHDGGPVISGWVRRGEAVGAAWR
jgi:hypothetical protein